MYSTAGARAANMARANAVIPTTGARVAFTRRRWCDVRHYWRTCCDQDKGWCGDVHHHGACAAIAAGAVCTFGARAAITSWRGEPRHRRTCCDHLQEMVMHSTAGARAAIKQSASVTPQRFCCRNSSLRV